MRRSALTLGAFLLATGPAAALELMTGDGLLLGLAEGEARSRAANQYLAGAFESLIVVNEIATAEDGRLFCLSEERARLLDGGLLRQEFIGWLRAPPGGRAPDPTQGRLPLPVLAWSFMAQKFPCATSEPQPLDAGIRSRLRESVPEDLGAAPIAAPALSQP
jgi:hypothetical protein